MLQADLDCASTLGIVLEKGSTLDFAGHGIADGKPYAIRCAGNACALLSSTGTGEISGSATAISVWGGRGPVQVRDITIRDSGPFPVQTQGAIDAVDARLDLIRVRILNALANYGIIARRIVATDVEVSGGTGIGLFAIRSLVASNLTTDGNGEIGVLASPASVTGLNAPNNGRAGLASARPTIEGGEITGNGSQGGPDVLARAPRFSAVICGTSQRLRSDPPVTLGVCAND